MADLAGATLEAVRGDDGEHDAERNLDGGRALGGRGERNADRERGRKRQQVELVGAPEQVGDPDGDERRERPSAGGRPPPEQPRRVHGRAGDEQQREEQFQELVRVGADVTPGHERQALQVLQAREPGTCDAISPPATTANGASSTAATIANGASGRAERASRTAPAAAAIPISGRNTNASAASTPPPAGARRAASTRAEREEQRGRRGPGTGRERHRARDRGPAPRAPTSRPRRAGRGGRRPAR